MMGADGSTASASSSAANPPAEAPSSTTGGNPSGGNDTMESSSEGTTKAADPPHDVSSTAATATTACHDSSVSASSSTSCSSSSSHDPPPAEASTTSNSTVPTKEKDALRDPTTDDSVVGAGAANQEPGVGANCEKQSNGDPAVTDTTTCSTADSGSGSASPDLPESNPAPPPSPPPPRLPSQVVRTPPRQRRLAPDNSATTATPSMPVQTATKAAARTPQKPQTPQAQQTSPFPKFEPYRPHSFAHGRTEEKDANEEDEDDDFDEDEWGDFDGFHDEDVLEMPSLPQNATATATANHIRAEAAPQPPQPPQNPLFAATFDDDLITPNAPSMLTMEDIEICQRLDEEFDRALEEREIGWTARYQSVRQSACLSLTFMATYMVLGCMFFFRHTDWALDDTLLFTIYTVTTVGYGNHPIPTTPGVQLFIIFFILVGIATLTIMVAQVYQCIKLETARAQYSRDKAGINQNRNQSNHLSKSTPASASSAHGSVDEQWAVDFDAVSERQGSCSDRMLRDFDRIKKFLRHTEIGRGVSVILPFVGLISIGAAVVGPIEGWTFVESIYFAVVSLTTVGFGDYFPTKKASTWFCILWLPFSVGFMSLYLGGVAHFYIQLSNSNIKRLERQMRRRIRKAKEWAEKERQQASVRVEAANAAERKKQQQLEVESGTDNLAQDQDPESKAVVAPVRKVKRDDFFQTLSSGESNDDDDEEGERGLGKQGLTARSHHFGSPETETSGSKRRARVIANATRCDELQGGGFAHGDSDLEDGVSRPRGRTMSTMRDVINAVHGHISSIETGGGNGRTSETLASIMSGDVSVRVAPETELMSIRSSSRVAFSSGKTPTERKPSFALRVLVQERLAEIIAIEIAGYQSHLDIKDNTMSVTIDRLVPTLDKWFIPRRARKAFRAVSFETLYFVGERGLITRGAASLYDLTPFEFHSLFAPLLAAMGDADTMESWLESTDVLADVDLKRDGVRSGSGSSPTGSVKRKLPSERLASVQERQKANVGGTVAPNVSNIRPLTMTVPGNAFKSAKKKTVPK